MPNKNISASDNSSTLRRPRAAAKPATQREPATSASSSRQSSSEGDAPIDTGADMSEPANASQGIPGYEEIAEAAYLRFLSRGCQDGADFDDWVEAERELRSRLTT